MTKKTAVEPWHKFVVDEIDSIIKRGKKRPTEWERDFFDNVKGMVNAGIGLTHEQSNTLSKLHGKMTELPRIKW